MVNQKRKVPVVSKNGQRDKENSIPNQILPAGDNSGDSRAHSSVDSYDQIHKYFDHQMKKARKDEKPKKIDHRKNIS